MKNPFGSPERSPLVLTVVLLLAARGLLAQPFEIFTEGGFKDCPAVVFNSRSEEFAVLGIGQDRLSFRAIPDDPRLGGPGKAPRSLDAWPNSRFALDAAVDPESGTALVVWAAPLRQGGPAPVPLWGALVDRDGQRRGRRFLIARENFTPERVQVGFLPEMGLWAVRWHSAEKPLGLQTIDRSGVAVGPVHHVPLVGRSALDPVTGELLVVWVESCFQCDQVPEILAQRVDLSGNLAGDRLTIARKRVSDPQVSYSSDLGGWLVGWTGRRNAAWVSTVRGNDVSPHRRVAKALRLPGGQRVPASLVGLAPHPSRPLHLAVWSSGPDRLLARWVGSSGRPVGRRRELPRSTSSDFFSMCAEENLACSSSGNCLLAWPLNRGTSLFAERAISGLLIEPPR